MDAVMTMKPSIRTGIYRNEEQTVLVMALATHASTGERMVVYQDEESSVLTCGEQEFEAKGLNLVLKVNSGRMSLHDLMEAHAEKAKNLSWLT